jgi:hypothetical protein
MFIVIDTLDTEFPMIVCDPDSLVPLLFHTREEAEAWADDCQGAIIVEY